MLETTLTYWAFAFGNIVELLLKGARVVVLKKGEVAFERVDEQDAEVCCLNIFFESSM